MSDEPELTVECYPTESVWLPKLVPGRPQRGWMDAFHDRHAYRCLPLTMANTTGWELLCPGGITATWNGGRYQEDITIKADLGKIEVEAMQSIELKFLAAGCTWNGCAERMGNPPKPNFTLPLASYQRLLPARFHYWICQPEL